MKPSISKLTSKYQATIPEAVSEAAQRDLNFAGALEDTLEEWNSDADDEAYRDL